jgi:hypothetical protein
MPAAEASVQTRDASRYLIRLCQHAGKMRARVGHQPAAAGHRRYARPNGRTPPGSWS